MRFGPPPSYEGLLDEVRSIFLAFWVVSILLGAGFFYLDYRLDQYHRFLKSQHGLLGKFDQWKRDQRVPPSQRPPTE